MEHKTTIIYNESMPRPGLQESKLEKASAQIAGNLNKFEVSINSSIKNTLDNTQQMIADQYAYCKDEFDKINNSISAIRTELLTINEQMFSIMKDLRVSLGTFLSEIHIETEQDVTKNIEKDEIPKDWISDEEQESIFTVNKKTEILQEEQEEQEEEEQEEQEEQEEEIQEIDTGEQEEEQQEEYEDEQVQEDEEYDM